MRPGAVLRQGVIRSALSRYVRSGCRVLDVGGHDGSVSAGLASAGASIAVVDVDVAGLAGARSRGVAAMRASATALPYRDGVFDAVLLLDVLCSVPEGHEDAVLHEAARVLRGGGHLILTELDRDFALPFVDQRLVYRAWQSKPALQYEDLVRLIMSGGGRICEHHRFYGLLSRFVYTVFYYLNVPARGTRIKRLLWRATITLERVCCLWPQAHLVIARYRPSVSES